MPEMTGVSQHPRRPLQSAGALFLGFIAVLVLSIGTDQVLHDIEVFPPWGQPMHDPSLNLLALTYRIAYGVIGSYVAARFAPHAPMRHALVLGGVGFVLSLVGVAATSGMDLGPRWFPIALVLTALPGAWLGGVLHRATRGKIGN
jgi:hypothetical protein